MCEFDYRDLAEAEMDVSNWLKVLKQLEQFIACIKSLLLKADFSKLSFDKFHDTILTLCLYAELEFTLAEKVLLFDRLLESANKKEEGHFDELMAIAELFFGAIDKEFCISGEEVALINEIPADRFGNFLRKLEECLLEIPPKDGWDEERFSICENIKFVLGSIAKSKNGQKKG